MLALGCYKEQNIYIWSIAAFIELTFEEQIILPNALKEKNGLLEIERRYFRTGWVWEVES